MSPTLGKTNVRYTLTMIKNVYVAVTAIIIFAASSGASLAILLGIAPVLGSHQIVASVIVGLGMVSVYAMELAKLEDPQTYKYKYAAAEFFR